MLKSIFISFVLLCSFMQMGVAQEADTTSHVVVKKIVIHQEKQEGLALGIDLAPFILQWMDPARKGLNFTGRINFKENWFGVAELGYENFNFKSDRFNYLSNGTAIKFGADYDVYNPDEKGNKDNIFFGLRYGFAWQNQSSSAYTIENNYWNNTSGSISPYSLNTHFAELLFGVRTEVVKNFFMGFSLRVKGIIYSSNTGILEPTSIPGYGVPNPINFGFSYNLEYQIPYLWKKK